MCCNTLIDFHTLNHPCITLGLAESGWVIEEQVQTPEGLPMKVSVGAGSSWHPPRVWSLFSSSLALDPAGATLDMLGLSLWLPKFFGLYLMVAVPGGDVWPLTWESPQDIWEGMIEGSKSSASK